jgi:S1-C subfamily serine protease
MNTFLLTMHCFDVILSLQGGDPLKKTVLFYLIFSLFLSTASHVAFAAESKSMSEKYEVMKQKNIFAGKQDGLPHFADFMTRAEMATVLSRLFQLTILTKDPSFLDTKTHWAQKDGYIETVKKAGLMEGKGGNLFDPEGRMTLEELSIVMVRGLKLPLIEPTPKLNASVWAQSYVATAIKYQIISDQADYTAPASRYELVNSAFFADQAMHPANEATLLSAKDIVIRYDSSVVSILADNNTSKQSSQGSGFAVAPNLFATNYHVIKGADRVSIVTSDNRSLISDGFVYVDEKNDLAVIHATGAEQITSVTLKPTNTPILIKGQNVIAIGSPQGLSNTVSEGIISGFRQNNGTDWIQISVPIDHGSSGGALFDQLGEVIGVTSAGVDSSNANLNFAIPVHYLIDTRATWEKAQIQSYGSAVKPVEPGLTLPATIETSKGALHVVWSEITDMNGAVTVDGILSSDDYETVYNPNYDEVKQQVFDWAEKWGDKLDSEYSGKEVNFKIHYQKSFNYDPSKFFYPEEIKKMNNKWDVDHAVVVITLSDTIEWTIYP